MEQLISIIVPVYNLEEYLQLCIESLIAQTYKNIEILLINDGSTDNSAAICDNAALLDERIKVIHRENGGAARARNDALAVAKGEFVTFVDGDDMILLDYIETLYNDLIENNADISCCSWQDLFEGEKAQEVPKFEEVILWSREQALEHLLYQDKIDSSMWSKLYKATLFEGIAFPPGNLYEDLAIIYKVFAKASVITYREYHSYVYLLRSQGTTLTTFSVGKMGLIDVVDEMVAYIDKEYSQILPAARSRFIRANFHIYLQIPQDEAFATQRKRIEKNIIRYRAQVLKDKKARRGTKIALLSTYLGFSTLYRLRRAKKLGKK